MSRADGDSTPDQRVAQLGITLPTPMEPAGLYVPAIRTDDLVFLSGAGPVRADGSLVTGKVGGDVDLDTARDAARLTGLQLLAVLAAELGTLDRVVGIVKVLGLVNCAPGFTGTPGVIDGCSQLFVDVFGAAGRSARSAIGVAELPMNICVEIEAVVRYA